jgi:hypothetical protein
MRFKRDRHRLGTVGPRTRDDFCQYMRVGSMHAVEVANGGERRPEIGRDFLEFMKDAHESGKLLIADS